jgi:signal transduction histidine kinase
LNTLGRALDRISNESILEPLPEHGPQEIRSLIQAYNDAVKRLQEAEKDRQSLLANIVHELGRPLGALKAAIQALQRGGDGDAVFREELLAGMVVQIERLQPMLENLTQLYEVLPGDLKIEPQPTDLNTWLSELLTPWKAAAQAKGLSWQRDISFDSSVVSIDPNRMAQALGNILSNAVKYTPAGGQIKVKVLILADELLISVRDTGPGIDPSEQELIFEPFYRSRRETRFPQGMGLGLSIARDIIQAHGGRITVESEHGTGTAFTISLPNAAG